MSRWRLAAGVALPVGLAVALVVVLAGAAGDGVEPVTAATPAPVAEATPSPSPTPTVSPFPSPSPSPERTPELDLVLESGPRPELHNTGEDFEAIWRSIAEFESWIARNPDPDLLQHTRYEDGANYQSAYQFVTRMAENGWRFADQGSNTIHVEVVDRPGPNTVVLRVSSEKGMQTVVDRNDNVVEAWEGWDLETATHVLQRLSDERWRIDSTTLGDSAASEHS